MNCWTCNQEITGDSVSIYLENDNSTQLLSHLHPECYNTIVQYLQEARIEWDNAVAVQTEAHRSARLPGTTAEAGRTPRIRL